MAEQNGTTAASTPAQSDGQAQPGGQGGGSAQSNGELESLRAQFQATAAERDRYRQQYEGSKGYYEAGSKYGIKDPKGFERVAPILELVNSGKIRPEQLAKAFAEEDAGQDQPPDMKAMLEQFAKEQGFVSKAEMERLERVREAKAQHQEMSNAEKAALKELMSKIVPENADDWDREVYEGYLEYQLNQKRPLYGKGHPLYSEDNPNSPEYWLSPFDRAALEKHLTELAARRDSVRGAKAAAKGDAHNASRGKTATVAGAAASIKTQPDKEDTDREPVPTKASLEDAYRRIKSGRAGSAV